MQDKVVLITGGTGSFGKSFCKDVLTKGVRQVRIFSRDELKQAQMKEEINDPRVDYLCGDIRDAERISVAMEGVDVCIHAAAMKRIEKCERDPGEAVKTNVLGTMNVISACLKNNVKNAILISTDKACYPVNLYGATKLTAEKIWNQSNTYRGLAHPTKFSVVRYGNVLGSRGSVLHIFKDQLEKGVIKVTDQNMTRFFITLQQAIDLVHLAVEEQQGGEIFIPKLKAASIYHLAEIVAGSMPVIITSQRGGEKVHEQLVTDEENVRRTYDEAGFSIIHPEITTWAYLKPPMVRPEDVKAETSETAPHYSDVELRNLLRAL